MKIFVYSVFDSKMASFGALFMEQRDEAAIRQFSDSVNDPDKRNNWFKHPEDYSLFRVGSFESELGKLEPCVPLNLVTASALKAAVWKDEDKSLVVN